MPNLLKYIVNSNGFGHELWEDRAAGIWLGGGKAGFLGGLGVGSEGWEVGELDGRECGVGVGFDMSVCAWSEQDNDFTIRHQL